jgi:hypothetical protein
MKKAAAADLLLLTDLHIMDINQDMGHIMPNILSIFTTISTQDHMTNRIPTNIVEISPPRNNIIISITKVNTVMIWENMIGHGLDDMSTTMTDF